MDRSLILGVMPKTGSIKQLTVRKDLQEKVKLSQEEITKFDIQDQFNSKEEPVGMLWNKEGKVAVFEYEFTDLEIEELKVLIKFADKFGVLHEDNIALCQQLKLA